MPYKIVQQGDKHCVVKSADGKSMGCHPTRDEAVKHMQALYANEAMSSEVVWVDPFAYTAGKPFRIFPVGMFKRGDHTIDLTPERLAQMKANYEAQRPRWKIPIYAGHPTEAQPDPPKLGNIAKLELQSDGLYAVPELTDEGTGLINDGKYQYISPGVLWKLSGGTVYTDEQGTEHDNVLDHIALTNRPFFGNQTSIFSSDANLMKGGDAMVEDNKLTTLFNMFRALFADAMMKCPKCEAQMKQGGKCPDCGYQDKSLEGMVTDNTPDTFKDYNTEQRSAMAKSGAAMPDGAYPIADAADLQNAIHAIGRGSAPHATIKAHIMKRAKTLGKTDMLPEDWTKKGDDNMSDPIINVEEFNALKQKAEQFDALKVQADGFAARLETERARADTLAEQFTVERKTRAIEGLKVRAEKFAIALPVKPDEYADKFYALGEQNAELAKWFMDKFDALNTVLAQSAVFTQLSRDNAANTDETIETLATKIVTEKFSGNMQKYGEALVEAGKQRPDLAEAYANLSQ